MPSSKKRDSNGESKPDSRRNDRHAVDIDQAGENAGVEDTPYNAPEEDEARERLRRNK